LKNALDKEYKISESEFTSDLNLKTLKFKQQKEVQEKRIKDEIDALLREEERQRKEYQHKLKSIEEK